MPAKPKPVPEPTEGPELFKGSAILTYEMWELVRKEADRTGRSESHVLREAVGDRYSIPAPFRHPARVARRKS